MVIPNVAVQQLALLLCLLRYGPEEWLPCLQLFVGFFCLVTKMFLLRLTNSRFITNISPFIVRELQCSVPHVQKSVV